MILTKTPLRISLFGGGSDMPEFYRQYPGAVLSFTIDKHIYVGVNQKFDGRTRVSYSQTEVVNYPGDLRHDLVRETLLHYGLGGLEITSVSDIPGEGSGLGSSSAFTVGLVMALTALSGGSQDAHPSTFAQKAYEIERELCNHPVGKQDHYAAAHGGVNFFQFNSDGTVNAERLNLSPALRDFLEKQIMLFWTGRTRKAGDILKEQAGNLEKDNESFMRAKWLAMQASEARGWLEDGKFDDLGEALDIAWYYKKGLAKVTDSEIDFVYSRAKLAGAEGGKICGAGGGGFLMLIAQPENQSAIEEAVGLRRIPFKVEVRGSRVIYKD